MPDENNQETQNTPEVEKTEDNVESTDSQPTESNDASNDAPQPESVPTSTDSSTSSPNSASGNNTEGASQTTRTVVTILLLLFLTPIGIIVMFLWSQWPKWVKIVTTIVLVFMMIVAPALLFGSLLALGSDVGSDNTQTEVAAGTEGNVEVSNADLSQRCVQFCDTFNLPDQNSILQCIESCRADGDVANLNDEAFEHTLRAQRLLFNLERLAISPNTDEATLTNLLTEILNEYELAAEAQPDNAGLWTSLGITYTSFASSVPGANEKGLEAFNKAIALEPDNFEIYYYMGIYQANNGELDLAKENLQKALELVPEDQQTYKLTIEEALRRTSLKPKNS